MKKKDLLSIPADDPPRRGSAKNLPHPSSIRELRYILTASLHSVSGCKLLTATFWSADITQTPEFTVFCDRESRRFWTYLGNGKWSEACLHNLIASLNNDYRAPMLSIAHADKLSLELGASYFEMDLCRTTANCILDFQLAARSQCIDECCVMGGHTRPVESIHSQYYSSSMFLNTIMDQAKPIPDLSRWAENHVFPERYFWYRREGQQLDGFCSHCRKDGVIPVPKGHKGPLHNHFATCPHCGSRIILKAHGRAIRMNDEGRMEYLQRIDNGVLVRKFSVTRITQKDYRLQPHYCFSEDFRTLVQFDGQIHSFAWYVSLFGANEWRYADRYFRGYYGYYGSAEVGEGTLYTANVNQVLYGTRWKYCQLAEFGRHVPVLKSDKYLKKYSEAPCMEYLVKCGMFRLLSDFLNGEARLNMSGRTPVDVLGVQKEDVRTLMRLNVSGKELDIWEWCRKKKRPLSEKDMRLLQSANGNSLEFIQRLDAKIVSKVLRYAARQPYNIADAARDWIDYCAMCFSLNYDMNDKATKWPRDLKKAHDKVVSLVKVKRNLREDQKIKAQYESYCSKYAYREKKYFIAIPRGVEDLIQEGQGNHNCVGTYIDRVADQDCVILFIRRTEAPDTPFVTAELRGGRLVQIQANFHCKPSSDVMGFWERFMAARVNSENQTMSGKAVS